MPNTLRRGSNGGGLCLIDIRSTNFGLRHGSHDVLGYFSVVYMEPFSLHFTRSMVLDENNKNRFAARFGG